MGQTSNWFSNILPAIEAIPQNIGNALTQQKAHGKQTGAISPVVQGVGQGTLNNAQAWGHALLPAIVPATTPKQDAQAQAVSEGVFSPYSIADPANAALGSAIDTGITAAKPAMKVAANEIKANVNANGGAQAGYVRPSAFVKPKEAGAPEPQNGGQYQFEGQLSGVKKTPAQVKSNTTPNTGRGVYVPPEDTTMKISPQATPLKQGGETFPQASATQQATEKPFPKVADQPVQVTDRTGTHPVTGGNPVWLDFSDQAKKNPYYLDDQNKAQEVLDNYVSGNTPREVQANLPQQLTEESQRIKNTLATNPQSMTKQNLIDNNALAMQKAAIKPGEGSTAQDATNKLIASLNDQINAGNKNVVPSDNITDTQLQTYIKKLDSYLQSAYKKIDNNATPLPEETAALTMRRTASSALKSMHPSLGDALDRQSAMIDAQPYVAKAASQQMGEETKAAINELNKPKLNIFQRGINSVKSNPVGYGVLSLVGSQYLPPIVKGAVAAGTVASQAIGTELPRIQNAWSDLTGAPKSNNNDGKYTPNVNHNSTMITPKAPDVNHLPQSQDDVQVGQDGSANLYNPFDSKTGIGISTTTYNQRLAKLNAQQQTYNNQFAKDAGNYQAQQVDAANAKGIGTQIDTLNALNESSRKLDDPYHQAQVITSGAKNTLNDLDKSGSNLLESNGTINDTLFKTNGPYSKLVSSVLDLQNKADMVIYTPGISAANLRTNILQAEQKLLYNNYYSKLGGSYTGGANNLPPGPAGGVNTQPAPVSTALPDITSGTVGPGGTMQNAAQTQAANPAYVPPALQ